MTLLYKHDCEKINKLSLNKNLSGFISLLRKLLNKNAYLFFRTVHV